MQSVFFSGVVNPSSARIKFVALPLLLGTTSANALVLTPVFDSSITSNANAAKIEGSINSAISAIDKLYGNAVTLAVDFTYTAAASSNLLSTAQYFGTVSYSDYVTALRADAASHPNNTVLSTAISNLSYGNDANGSKNVAINLGLAEMLGFISSSLYNNYIPVININSNQAFGFSQPVSSSTYDLTGGLEHELDEVLGGGGAGSTLNSVYNSSSLGAYVGPLDLYRYSALHTSSFTTSGSASSYFSINGGATDIVGFNQTKSGDYGDFAPSCDNMGSGLLIQNAFNCKGPYEAYTTSSPEFTMLQAIGWSAAVPEPATIPLLVSGLLGLGAVRRRPV